MRRLAWLALVLSLWPGLAPAQDDAALKAAQDRALAAFQSGDAATALQLSEQALDLARRQDAPDPELFAFALHNVAYLVSGSDADRAETLWQEALDDLRARDLMSSAAGLTVLVEFGGHLDRLGDPARARDLFDQAQRAGRGTPFQGHAALAAMNFHLGRANAADAIIALSEVTQSAPDLLAPAYADLYARFTTLIDSAEAEGRGQDIAAYLEGKMIVLRTYYPGADRDQTLRDLMFQRFTALRRIGDYGRARDQILVWQNTGTPSEQDRAFVAEMTAQAERFASESLVIATLDQLQTARETVGFLDPEGTSGSLTLAQSLRRIASAESHFGQTDRAARTLEQAADMFARTTEGQRHLPAVYGESAWIAFLRGRNDEAEALFRRADATAKALPAGANPERAIDRAWSAANHARFLADTDRPEAALERIAQARQILQTAPGTEDEAWLGALLDTQLLTQKLWLDDALAPGSADPDALFMALNALRDLAPPDSADLAMALANGADAAQVFGQTDTARAFLEDAIAINSRSLPDIAPQAIDTRASLALLDLVNGERARAIDLLRAVTEARKSPAYRAGLADAAFDFETFAWLLIDDAGSRSRAYENEAFEALQWTQITAAAEAVQGLELRLAVDDPTRGALLRARQDLVERHADLSARISASALADSPRVAAGSPTLARDLRQLDGDLAAVDTRLAAMGLGEIGLTRIDPLSIADVQALLSPGEALITFVLPSLNPDYIVGLEGSSNHVIAIAHDAVHIARMGEISRRGLNARIAAFRCDMALSDPGCSAAGMGGLRGAMQAGGPARQDSGPGMDTEAAHALYRDLFGGLDPVLARYPHLIIAPPPDLLRLPFAALLTAPAPQGRLRDADWMIRRHALSVLPSIASLRTLRAPARPPRRLDSMLGVGDPVIGSNASVDCGAMQLAALRAAPADIGYMSVAAAPGEPALADVAALSRLPRLPDAVCELRAIAAGFAPGRSTLRLGAEATETGIKDMDKSGALAGYDVLVFATHGLTAGEAGAQSPGLVLTPPLQASLRDDGLLSAGEIAALDLDASLVVLSACNTAAGARANEDGLSGLARAFFQSGAQALLVTHWSVYSEAAVEISTGVFGALEADPGLTYAAALQRAVLSVLADPARPAWQRHPSYWAAFALVGAT